MQKRVLIADSDELCLNAMGALLRDHGFACDCEDSASGVIRKLSQKQHYDCLIVDVMLAGNEDLGVVSTIAEIDRLLPVIVIAGSPSQKSAITAVELKVEAYLVKPVKANVMVEKVSKAADLCRVRRKAGNIVAGCEKWREELLRFESHLQTSRGLSPITAVHVLFDLMMKNLVTSVLDLKEVLQAADGLASPEKYRSQDDELEEALAHAVEVLKSTKISFKSKQIAQLRQMLEQKLKNIRKG